MLSIVFIYIFHLVDTGEYISNFKKAMHPKGISLHGKKILSWRLSNTMDVSLATIVLKEALVFYPKPEIFHTDQGRAIDNICIERF